MPPYVASTGGSTVRSTASASVDAIASAKRPIGVNHHNPMSGSSLASRTASLSRAASASDTNGSSGSDPMLTASVQSSGPTWCRPLATSASECAARASA